MTKPTTKTKDKRKPKDGESVSRATLRMPRELMLWFKRKHLAETGKLGGGQGQEWSGVNGLIVLAMMEYREREERKERARAEARRDFEEQAGSV